MPPRRSSATARATVVAATHMTVATGTEGVVVLSQWFKKMESMFYISNCATVTQDVACAMDWKALKKMMTVKYRPKGEIKKLEIELSNLKVKVEKYVGGLPDMIRGNVMSYQPKMMEKEIEFSNDQMDQKVLTITKRQAKQKRKLEFNAGNNQGHQQQNKRQNTRIMIEGLTNLQGLNAVTCYEYGVQGHFKRDCPNLKHGNRSNQRGNGNAPAKVYMVGNAGTNSDSNVVTGMFLLNDRYASILFDTGADRSFISTTFSSYN
ncbi:putative reverse transcriptase domain-containing protein [Tanacetum coccineum]